MLESVARASLRRKPSRFGISILPLLVVAASGYFGGNYLQNEVVSFCYWYEGDIFVQMQKAFCIVISEFVTVLVERGLLLYREFCGQSGQ